MIPKFRAWEKKNKRWMTKEIEDSEESEIRLDLWGNVEFKPPWWEQGADTVHRVDGSDMFDIMQSTGLFDDNGVEIFESDIVKVIDLNCRIEVISEVVWGMNSNVYGNYPAFAIQDFESESNSFSEIFDSGCYRIKVIGNIYENPELMEVQE